MVKYIFTRKLPEGYMYKKGDGLKKLKACSLKYGKEGERLGTRVLSDSDKKIKMVRFLGGWVIS